MSAETARERVRPRVGRALQSFTEAAKDGALAYTGYRGNRNVLEIVSRALAAFTGEHFDPEAELILTPGTQAGLCGALSAIVNEGDKVLLVDPGVILIPHRCRGVPDQAYSAATA